MKCVQGVDEKTRSARARQCSGNFGTDVSAFPDASDNKLALAFQYQFNGLVKTFINVRYQSNNASLSSRKHLMAVSVHLLIIQN